MIICQTTFTGSCSGIISIYEKLLHIYSTMYVKVTLHLLLTHSLLRIRVFALEDHKCQLLLILKGYAIERNISPTLHSNHSWNFINANYPLVAIKLYFIHEETKTISIINLSKRREYYPFHILCANLFTAHSTQILRIFFPETTLKK
jgi:hypothetical protein